MNDFEIWLKVFESFARDMNDAVREWYQWTPLADVIELNTIGWVVVVLLIMVLNNFTWVRLKDRLQYIALHDGLTGLPNRNLFNDRLNQAILSGRRERRQFAVMMLDLDHFKEINDSLGHQAGDELLKHVANTLKNSLRTTDTIARLGGDEFAILLSGFQDGESVSVVCRKIIQQFEDPFMIMEVPFQVGVSIGISIYPDHGDEANYLLQRADIALYRAKDIRNSFSLYHPQMETVSKETLILQNELRNAIKHEKIQVYFQPKIDCKSNKVKGVEALARWPVPHQGFVPPNVFIPLAKQSGQIDKLTMLILKKSILQASEWVRQGKFLSVSVNITGENLQDKNFPHDLAHLLQQYSFPAQLLELEITEDVIINNIMGATEVCYKLKEMGVVISIDDFGTGNSSISYLKKLPIKNLKIDQSFVREMRKSENDLSIVKATIMLSKGLGLQVTAEGVEDMETLKMLKDLDCNLIQGFLISRPVPADEFDIWLSSSPWGQTDTSLDAAINAPIQPPSTFQQPIALAENVNPLEPITVNGTQPAMPAPPLGQMIAQSSQAGLVPNPMTLEAAPQPKPPSLIVEEHHTVSHGPVSQEAASLDHGSPVGETVLSGPHPQSHPHPGERLKAMFSKSSITDASPEADKPKHEPQKERTGELPNPNALPEPQNGHSVPQETSPPTEEDANLAHGTGNNENQDDENPIQAPQINFTMFNQPHFNGYQFSFKE